MNGTQTYGEGSLPGATAGGQLQQPVPSRQQTTAQRRLEGSGLKKIIGESWNAISQSTPSRNGYRKRMLQIWVEKEMFHVTEQRLVDQENQIRKKQWLSELELEEIR